LDAEFDVYPSLNFASAKRICALGRYPNPAAADMIGAANPGDHKEKR
jgi:hypothetical protein